MLTLAGDEGELEAISPAHLPAVMKGLAQAQRRPFATDIEIEAAFLRSMNLRFTPGAADRPLRWGMLPSRPIDSVNAGNNRRSA
jgi:hypothetical protein